MQVVDYKKIHLIEQKRLQGFTYKEIGKELNISHQRVHQLYKRAKQFEPSQHIDHSLDDWDEIISSKHQSLYYSILVKQYGKDKADYIWDCRNFEPEIFNKDGTWEKVMKYKVRDPLILIV